LTIRTERDHKKTEINVPNTDSHHGRTLQRNVSSSYVAAGRQGKEVVQGETARLKFPQYRSTPVRIRPGTELTNGGVPDQSERIDLDSPELYLNKELTWLSFIWRILYEAQNSSIPLCERVKFLAVVDSYLDEFFMKRIGGLKQQVAAGVHERTADGRTAQQQLDACGEDVRALQKELRLAYQQIVEELRKIGVVVARYGELPEQERKKLREYYRSDIFPFITPQATDPAHPFPFLSNLSLNLLLVLNHPGSENEILARVKVPVGVGTPRFVEVGKRSFVPLEDIIASNLDLLFPNVEVKSCIFFRVTRNANTLRDEDTADDLLALIESELRDRKFAPIVRLEVSKGMNPALRGRLAAELGLNETTDIFEVDTLLALRDLRQIAALDIAELPKLNHHPVGNAKLEDNRSIFHEIREAGAILLHHPYESFTTSVERFMREASRDPKVRAIKMTLYRTSADTKIIDYLSDAAREGKQVAVVVELKARFDEAANIRWASQLEEFGIHVNYGVIGLKTHSKTIQVLRMDYDGLRRYVHIGTGNYHAGSAREHSDIGLLTCDEAIGKDITELFNYLTTGLKPSRHYSKVLTAPKHMKKAVLDRIEREISKHSLENPGLIRFKCNALVDTHITKLLYRASQAGVKIELIIRDSCQIRPGIAGLSDNISVISVVGLFLEHSRIFYFRNGGDEEFFIGSADLMTRNMESRVEVIVPVEDSLLQEDLREVFEVQLASRRNIWEMRPDGSFVQRQNDGNERGCQQLLIEAAERRHFEATRLRRRKPRGIARRVSLS